MKGNNEAALQEPAEMLLSAASLFFPSWSLACQPNPTALLLCAAPGHSCKLSPPGNVTSPENHTHRPRVLQGMHHLCPWAIVLLCFPTSEILGRLLPSRTIFPPSLLTSSVFPAQQHTDTRLQPQRDPKWLDRAVRTTRKQPSVKCPTPLCHLPGPALRVHSKIQHSGASRQLLY